MVTMTKNMKIIAIYIFWAVFLQHHAGAGQKLMAILNGQINRMWSLSGYLSISLIIIVCGVYIATYPRKPPVVLCLKVFLAWIVSFGMFWAVLVKTGGRMSIESIATMLIYFVVPHMLVPLLPLLLLALLLKQEYEKASV